MKRGRIAASILVVLSLSCSAEQGRPPGEQKDGYFEATVFFATDRAHEKAKDTSEVVFTGLRRSGDELTYGKVGVSLPDDRGFGEIPSPSWHRVWNRDDPTDFVLVLSTELFDGKQAFSGAISQLLQETGRDDVLLFIHGYNVKFASAATRTAQLAYDLKFTGAPIFYSWSSRGELDEYPADGESVKLTVPQLERFLRLVLTDLGARDVHVIVHSMGNRAFTEALSNFDPKDLPEGSARLRQIVLAAPDVDADLFMQLAKNFPGKADRITLYSSAEDKALLISEKLNDSSRAGNSIVVVDGVDTIDATGAEMDFLEHSYFGKSILPDIFSLILTDMPPDKRIGMTRMVTEQGTHWRMQAGSLP